MTKTPKPADAAPDLTWDGPICAVTIAGRDIVLVPGRPAPLPEPHRSHYLAAGLLQPAHLEA